MSNRKKSTYIAVICYVHENLSIANGLNCKSLMSDYEIAMTDAFLTVVPIASVTHCHFHFAQAVKRNAKKCTAMQNFIDA